jgi:hypothetical protein
LEVLDQMSTDLWVVLGILALAIVVEDQVHGE